MGISNASSKNVSIDPKTEFIRATMFFLLAGLGGITWLTVRDARYFPIADYPNHLASAFVLGHLGDISYKFGQFYRANWNTYPYLTMDVVLVGLQRILSIDGAGRMLLGASLLSVPAAAWYFIRRANPGEASLAFWSLLISNNMYFFLYGFVNLQLSLSFCLLVLGLWLGYLERPRWTSWALLLLVTTALYFTHLVGFAVAGLVMTCHALGARRRLTDLLSAWLLFVPGIICYLHAMWGLGPGRAMQFRTVADKALGLVAVMAGVSPAIDVLTLVVMAGCLAWVFAGNPEFKWNPGWRGPAAMLFLLYWLLPGAYGPATNVDRRLLPFLFVIALATARVGRKGRSLAAVAVLLFLIRAGAVELYFRSAQPHLARLEQSFQAIPPGARVLPLVDWAGGAPLPERHFWAYGVIRRGWLSPCLFHDPGVHPLAISATIYDPCQQALTPSATLDWKRVGSDFDYVWAYRVPRYSPALSSVGRLVFSDSGLEVFRLSRTSTAEGRRAP